MVQTARCPFADTDRDDGNQSMAENARESQASSHSYLIHTWYAYRSNRLCQLVGVLKIGEPFTARCRREMIPERLVTMP
jgi:hypothetical protein